jgi:hypothetical protein
MESAIDNPAGDASSPLRLFRGQVAPRLYNNAAEALRAPLGICVTTGLVAKVGRNLKSVLTNA